MTSVLRHITAAAVTAGVLLSLSAGSASANVVFPDGRVCFASAVYSFAGPSADIINSAGFPQQGSNVRVQDQGLLIFRNPGSLQTTNCSYLHLTESGGVFFENASSSTIDEGGWLSMQSNYRVSITGNSSLTNNGMITQSSGTIDIDTGSTLDGTGTTAVSGGTLRVNGLTVQSGVTITGGTLQGSGTMRADVANIGGTVGPGNSPGKLTVDGDYTQGAGGTLAMEIASLLSFDVLDITGSRCIGHHR